MSTNEAALVRNLQAAKGPDDLFGAARLEGADLKGADLRGAHVAAAIVWPAGFNWRANWGVWLTDCV